MLICPASNWTTTARSPWPRPWRPPTRGEQACLGAARVGDPPTLPGHGIVPVRVRRGARRAGDGGALRRRYRAAAPHSARDARLPITNFFI